jgi:hypothetical protein
MVLHYISSSPLKQDHDLFSRQLLQQLWGPNVKKVTTILLQPTTPWRLNTFQFFGRDQLRNRNDYHVSHVHPLSIFSIVMNLYLYFSI